MQYDYYQLLGIQRSFRISIPELESKYFMLQMHLHPDRLVNKSKEELELAANNSSQLNIAYTTLKNEFSRAEHMLELEGIYIKDENYMEQDMAFLDDAFTLRERLISADNTEVAALVNEVQLMKADMFEKFDLLYTKAAFNEAAVCIQKIKFLDRFLSEISVHNI